MWMLTAPTLSLCTSNLVAFGWGMCCFFRRPEALNARTSVVGFFGLVFAAWHLWAIGVATPTLARTIVAVGLYLGSLSLFFSAIRACGRHRPTAIYSNDVPTTVVRAGPYAVVRHPFYTAYILFWLAGSVASGSLVTLGTAFVMTGLYVQAARREERKFQASALAMDYAEYVRCAGFMLPRSRVRNLC